MKRIKRFSDILREARQAKSLQLKRLQEDELCNTNSEDETYEFTYSMVSLNKDSTLASRKQKLLEHADTLLKVKGSDVFLFSVWIPR
jgi:hypothetical protein